MQSQSVASREAQARPNVVELPGAPARPDSSVSTTTGTDNPPRPGAPKPGFAKRRLVQIVLLAALGAAGWFGYGYWSNGRFMMSTDDAYVGASMAAISPRIAAQVGEVFVDSNQKVKAGDKLIRLDDTDVRFALQQSEAKLATTGATIARVQAQLATADAVIGQAEAARAVAGADLIRAEAAWERVSKLSSSDFSSKATLDNSRADLDRARAQVANTDAGIANARAQRAVIETQLREAERAADEVRVTVARAQRDLASTIITAPVDGVIAARAVQVGDYVAPGKRLMSVVPLADVYVDANFKETDMAKIVPGTPVKISVDALPGADIRGTVVGLAPGTGSAFSLLPADNATGNFTKIVQRVPVRIAVRQPETGVELRPGLSVVVTIDRRAAAQP